MVECKGRIVVIDDEADYATPNAKINQGTKTRINELVGQLIGTDGYYIGVTATPARLDLNNTFKNDTEKWVNFPPHSKYTGQDLFSARQESVVPAQIHSARWQCGGSERRPCSISRDRRLCQFL